MKLHRVVFIVVLSISSALAGTFFGQGPLTPPGVPAPTMKTLDQVEARTPIDATHTPGQGADNFTINAAGSYYLTANLAVTQTFGIHVTSSNVSIDLNGFTVSGPITSVGIMADSGLKNVAIRNGFVTGLNRGVDNRATGGSVSQIGVVGCGTGIIIVTGGIVDSCIIQETTTSSALSATDGCTIQGCTFTNNHGSSCLITGDGCSVLNCIARNNMAPDGLTATFQTGRGAVVRNCVLNGNTADMGVLCAGYGVVVQCVVTFQTPVSTNLVIPLPAIKMQSGGVVTECSTTGGISGIITGDNATISKCSITGANDLGISTGKGCVIESCSVNGGQQGIYASDTSCVISGCSCVDVNGDGIGARSGCRIFGCVASSNSGRGIVVFDGCFISECVMMANGADGLVLMERSNYVLKCNSTGNMRDGFHRDPTSTNNGVNRIEGNHATLNGGAGFSIDRSFVLLNSSNLNGGANYLYFPASNFGPVGSISTATNPFSNFQ